LEPLGKKGVHNISDVTRDPYLRTQTQRKRNLEREVIPAMTQFDARPASTVLICHLRRLLHGGGGTGRNHQGLKKTVFEKLTFNNKRGR